MKADPKFASQPKSFWAAVRSLSQDIGYTIRGEGQVKVPTIREIRQAFENLRLKPDHIGDADNLTELASTLLAYYAHRAEILNKFVEPRLMDAKRAKSEFDSLKKKLKPSCPIPLNKQKGKKNN